MNNDVPMMNIVLPLKDYSIDILLLIMITKAHLS